MKEQMERKNSYYSTKIAHLLVIIFKTDKDPGQQYHAVQQQTKCFWQFVKELFKWNFLNWRVSHFTSYKTSIINHKFL
jgi:hypothetical protein